MAETQAAMAACCGASAPSTAPFTPPAPGFGTIRPRSTETHRDRLDPAAFAEACAAPNPATPPSVAILGAGLAGLTCAQALAEQGWNPTLFDKGRRPGGRLATRESRHSTLAFNHGAQEFEAQDPRFKERLTQWAESGWAVPTAQADRWSPLPRAASLPETLAEDRFLSTVARASLVFTGRGSSGRWKPNPDVAMDPSRALSSPYPRPSSRN